MLSRVACTWHGAIWWRTPSVISAANRCLPLVRLRLLPGCIFSKLRLITRSRFCLRPPGPLLMLILLHGCRSLFMRRPGRSSRTPLCLRGSMPRGFICRLHLTPCRFGRNRVLPLRAPARLLRRCRNRVLILRAPARLLRRFRKRVLAL